VKKLQTVRLQIGSDFFVDETDIEPACLIVCDVQYRGPQTADRKPRIQGRIRAMGALAGALLIGLDRLAHLNLIERASFPSDRKVERERERERERTNIFSRSLSCPVSVPPIMFDFDFIWNYFATLLPNIDLCWLFNLQRANSRSRCSLLRC